MMKIISGIVAALMGLAIGVALAPAHGAEAAVHAGASAPAPAIFLTPHQDDETLFMGAAIREHVLAGRDVWVLLLTDGGASYVCDGDHGWTNEDCIAERDREYRAAVNKMGAHAVILADRMKDGTLDPVYVESVIARWAAAYPGASFKTLGEDDSIHADHRAAGEGLRMAYDDGVTNDARWYLRYDDQPTYAGTCTARHNLNTALDLYRPIGWISAGWEFNRAYNTTTNRAAYSKVYGPTQRGLPGNGQHCYPDAS
jgi:LmbE family N-acetylglucosaminyl deacetylase